MHKEGARPMNESHRPRPTTAHPATRRRVLGGTLLAGPAVLAACAGPGAGAPAVEAKEVTLTYISDWSSGVRGEWVKAAMPRFTEENPKIKIQVDTWGGDVIASSIANAAAGTLQDVLLGANDVFIQLARSGAMQDITGALKTLKVKMEDLVHVPSTISYNGKQYGLPFQFIVQAMVLNKTIFRNASVPLPT